MKEVMILLPDVMYTCAGCIMQTAFSIWLKNDDNTLVFFLFSSVLHIATSH